MTTFTIYIQVNLLQDNFNSFRQNINDRKSHSSNYSSIEKIQQTASECKEKLIKYTDYSLIKIENQLNYLTKQFNDYMEKKKIQKIYLNELQEKLMNLKEQLNKLINISIEEQSRTFISQISITAAFETKWKEVGLTVAGGNGEGNQLNQLCRPIGICIDDDQTIYIADCENHRIVKWKLNATNGQIVTDGNGERKEMNHPTDVIIDQTNNNFLIIADAGNRRVIRWSPQYKKKTNAQVLLSDIDCCRLTMDKDGSLYISDCQRHEVKRWKRGENEGMTVAGGNGQGDQLNQLNLPTFIFVDDDYSVYVSDRNNHRVMKWMKDAKEGIIVAGGNGKGTSLRQLSFPEGVIVDYFGYIYVVDWGNHRVIRWCEEVKEGKIVVGENRKGKQSYQLNKPTDISYDREGNLYVADLGNDRIQKFGIDLTD